MKGRAVKLPAYITVEATFVMIIVFAAIFVSIVTAYNERAKVVAGFVNEGAASDGAYSEEIWIPGEHGVEKAEKNADLQLHAVSSLAGASSSIERNEENAVASVAGEDMEVNASCRINDAENYMRKISLVEDLIKWTDRRN